MKKESQEKKGRIKHEGFHSYKNQKVIFDINKIPDGYIRMFDAEKFFKVNSGNISSWTKRGEVRSYRLIDPENFTPFGPVYVNVEDVQRKINKKKHESLQKKQQNREEASKLVPLKKEATEIKEKELENHFQLLRDFMRLFSWFLYELDPNAYKILPSDLQELVNKHLLPVDKVIMKENEKRQQKGS